MKFSTSFTGWLRAITVAVEGGCTLEVSGGTAGSYADRTFSVTIAAGTAEVLTGVEATSTAASAMEVTCNVPSPGQAPDTYTGGVTYTIGLSS